MPTRPPNSPETTAIARLTPSDPHYPSELRDLQQNAPTELFCRGQLELLGHRPAVAIVGTRRATAYGLRITNEIAGVLSRAGACIVSGMARGIDGAAHRAALDAGGVTIAVLGTGLDVVYPKAHRALQAAVAEQGLLISELAADEHGMAFTFPRRNRIIAALASVTIVIEAPERSGALLTADCAADLQRVVACVPGNIDQPQSAGSNRLIRDGAGIVTSVEDAMALVGLTAPLRTPRGPEGGDEARIWTALADGPLTMDALCHRSGLPAAQCLAAVTTLEVAGSVECALTGEIRRR